MSETINLEYCLSLYEFRSNFVESLYANGVTYDINFVPSYWSGINII